MIDGSSTTRAARAPSATATLSRAVIAFESEESARRRLAAFGYPPDVAAEIAVYLAQSTDLPLFIDDITQALSREGIAAEFVDLDGLPQRLRDLALQSDRTIVWAFTDGVRFYRGSSVAALARLEGFARFGSPAAAAHLCQDKFASLALASAAGLAVPPSRLMEGEAEIAALGDWAAQFRTVVRQAEYTGGEDRHFRRQPLRAIEQKRTIGRNASGSATVTGR